ncbi:FecR family protein [Gaoshiqia sp. Z1-71]|uniref:FecR family protein n=1 Tax=Gaoshiqia hydrogeniformans TaxID=3290090 RepID=UPI003BF863A9
MRKDKNIPEDATETFDQFLEGKKNQTNTDQLIEAGLFISELKSVDTDTAYSILHSKINRRHKIQTLYTQFGRIAAVLILPLLIVSIWSLSQKSSDLGTEQLSYHEVSSPPGIRSKVQLPDGTTVWLNAESRIRYAIPFARATRELELTGEAFFDVAKNANAPMDVKFNNITVRVLGTQFNVKAFPDEDHLEVVLKEGSIELQNDVADADREAVRLYPNQQWKYDKTEQVSSLNQVDAEKYIAWHRNILILNNTPMEEMAKNLERWYGVDVQLMDQELNKYKFTTVFENEPLHRVLELLEMSSPIKITYVPGKIDAVTGKAEKSIIRINKMN